MEVFSIIILIIIVWVIGNKVFNSDLRRISKLANDLLGLDESTLKHFLNDLEPKTAQKLVNLFDPENGADSQIFCNFTLFYHLSQINVSQFIELVQRIQKAGYSYRLSHDNFKEMAVLFNTNNAEELAFKKAKSYEDMLGSPRFTLVLGGATCRSAENIVNDTVDLSESDLGISDLCEGDCITGVYHREPQLTFSQTWIRVSWYIATKFHNKFHVFDLNVIPNGELARSFYKEWFELPNTDHFVFLEEEMVLLDNDERPYPENCSLTILNQLNEIVYKSNIKCKYMVDTTGFILAHTQTEVANLIEIIKGKELLTFEVSTGASVLLKFDLSGNRKGYEAIASFEFPTILE